MLRSYQKELVSLALSPNNSDLNLLLQADTGAGKTHVLSAIAKKSKYVLAIAHRNILIKQISATFAKDSIKHNILATKHTQRQCVLEHRKSNNLVFTEAATKHVCSIDSLLSRHRRNRLTIDTQKPWVIIVDEAHHMIDKNKWGQLTKIFPNAKVIGATATPCRLDQQSLARSKGGVFDKLIQAEELKQNSVQKLIDMGFISPFVCYGLPDHIQESNLKLGTTGDYTYSSLNEETKTKTFKMCGDAVKYYKQLANNKQALAFCVSIDVATKTAEYFKNNDITAAAIHSNLSSVETARIFDLFQKKHIKVLCNVDMIGEGVDVPAIEALIMLRKTASFGMYRQWIGRSLRPEAGKEKAIILDHVGNVRTHDLPDKHIDWSLENPPIANKSCLAPCANCQALIKVWAKECEFCGQPYLAKESNQQTEAKYIDVALVELHKRKADEDTRQKQIKWQHENQINESSVNWSAGNGFIGSLVKKLRVMCVEHLQQFITIAQCNDFLKATQNQDFWITNFTNADIKKNNPATSLRVYKKWQKSN
jgi:superfamily II DNA or RNA helicase